MEDSQIIALFYERSERAIVELDRTYGAAVRKTAANILHDRSVLSGRDGAILGGSISAEQLEALADSFDFSIL